MRRQDIGAGHAKKNNQRLTVNFYVLGTILRVMHEFYHLILTPTRFYFPRLQIRKLMSRKTAFPKLVNCQLGIIFKVFMEIGKWVSKWIE